MKDTTKAVYKYNKENCIQLNIQLNKKTDADIIEHLDNLHESKRGYVLRLIRNDIYEPKTDSDWEKFKQAQNDLWDKFKRG